MAGFYARRGKRLFDLVVAIPGCLVLTPIVMATSVAVRIRLGSPILFVQTRPGLHSAPFQMYKFRSMTDEEDEHGVPLPDGERLTDFGKALRRTSLDELPELMNVIRGEMSLVGPRPLLMSYLELYLPSQRRRHEVHPGITGWAQVNGRNAMSWEEKFEHDVWYVNNVSLWLDVKILARTVSQVLRREGVTESGQATASAFQGTQGVAMPRGKGETGSAGQTGTL